MIITVPRPFEGPRHSRAYAIWEAAARSWDVEVRWISSPGSHIGVLNKWRDIVVAGEPHHTHVFCEHDVLPLASLPETMAAYLLPHRVVCPAAYRKANPDATPLITSMGAAWIVGLNPRLLKGHQVDFRRGKDPAEDPGNLLPYTETAVFRMPAEVQMPGLFYQGIGLHVFWSRGWNGDPGVWGPFDGEKVLKAVDMHLTEYEGYWEIE